MMVYYPRNQITNENPTGHADYNNNCQKKNNNKNKHKKQKHKMYRINDYL